MSTTPIADLLGIDTSSRQIATGFEFRGQKFYWCAPTPNQRETLLRGRLLQGAAVEGVRLWSEEFCGWFGRANSSIADGVAVFLTPNDHRVTDTDTILSEARAAIAAQGGAK